MHIIYTHTSFVFGILQLDSEVYIIDLNIHLNTSLCNSNLGKYVFVLTYDI